MRSKFPISLILLLFNFSLATATSPQKDGDGDAALSGDELAAIRSHHQRARHVQGIHRHHQEEVGTSDPAEAVQQRENKGKRVAVDEPTEPEHGSEAKRQRGAQPTHYIRIGHGHEQQNTVALAAAHPGRTVQNVPLGVGGGLFDAVLEEHAREQQQQQQEVQLDELTDEQKRVLLELEEIDPDKRDEHIEKLRVKEGRKLKQLKQEKQELEKRLKYNHQKWLDMENKNNKHLVKALTQVVSNPGPQQYRAIENTPDSLEFRQRIDNKRPLHITQDPAFDYYDLLVRHIKEHQAMLAALLSYGATLEPGQHPPMAQQHVQAVQETPGSSMAHFRHGQAVPGTFPATGQHFMPLQSNQHAVEQPMHHGFPHRNLRIGYLMGRLLSPYNQKSMTRQGETMTSLTMHPRRYEGGMIRKDEGMDGFPTTIIFGTYIFYFGILFLFFYHLSFKNENLDKTCCKLYIPFF